MKAGKLDHLEPLVSVMGVRQGGNYTFGGSNFAVSGMTISFDLKKGLDQPYAWAKIISLPAWYPPWVGEVPIEIRLNGALLQAVPLPGSQPSKEPAPRPAIAKGETRLGGSSSQEGFMDLRRSCVGAQSFVHKACKNSHSQCLVVPAS
jgi:hypothetical protein